MAQENEQEKEYVFKWTYKLVQIGGVYRIALPKEIVEGFNWEKGQTLSVEADFENYRFIIYKEG